MDPLESTDSSWGPHSEVPRPSFRPRGRVDLGSQCRVNDVLCYILLPASVMFALMFCGMLFCCWVKRLQAKYGHRRSYNLAQPEVHFRPRIHQARSLERIPAADQWRDSHWPIEGVMTIKKQPAARAPDPIPPWKQELLMRKTPLARTVEPNLSFICQKWEANVPESEGASTRRPINELARLARRSRSLGEGKLQDVPIPSERPLVAPISLSPPPPLPQRISDPPPPGSPPPTPPPHDSPPALPPRRRASAGATGELPAPSDREQLSPVKMRAPAPASARVCARPAEVDGLCEVAEETLGPAVCVADNGEDDRDDEEEAPCEIEVVEVEEPTAVLVVAKATDPHQEKLDLTTGAAPPQFKNVHCSVEWKTFEWDEATLVPADRRPVEAAVSSSRLSRDNPQNRSQGADSRTRQRTPSPDDSSSRRDSGQANTQRLGLSQSRVWTPQQIASGPPEVRPQIPTKKTSPKSKLSSSHSSSIDPLQERFFPSSDHSNVGPRVKAESKSSWPTALKPATDAEAEHAIPLAETGVLVGDSDPRPKFSGQKRRRSVTFSCPEVVETVEENSRSPHGLSEARAAFGANTLADEDSDPGVEVATMGENSSLTEDDLDHCELDNISQASLARIYRTNAKNVGKKSAQPIYATPSPLDSDGTFNSGGDSDSSEELHYGPGFVSRLKLRYMSVTMRSTTGRGARQLRRTASLENFLDKDKDDSQIELRKTTTAAGHKKQLASPYSNHRHSAPPEGGRSTSSGMFTKRGPPVTNYIQAAARARSKSSDSMKRAQSVEVLSMSEGSPPKSSPIAERVPPPPLPPKSEKIAPLEAVVNSLANENVRVQDRHGRLVQPAPAQQEVPVTRSGESSVNSASPRRPMFKRRSSSLLFGVEEKELPAPDTVKETRKIFESRSGGPGGRKPGPFYHVVGRVKSRSTSSLYHSRSRSSDRGLSPSSQDSNSDTLTRNGSEENLPRLAHTRISRSPTRGESPVVTGRGPSKPSLPAKPTHLASPSPSPTSTTKTFKSIGGGGSHAPTPSKTFKTPSTSHSGVSLHSNTSVSGDHFGSATKPTLGGSKFAIPPLRPVSGSKMAKHGSGGAGIPNQSKPPKHDQNNSTIGSNAGRTSSIVKQVSGSSAKLNKDQAKGDQTSCPVVNDLGEDKVQREPREPMAGEESIKRISHDSITKIREGGSSVSFNFNKAAPAIPAKRATPPAHLPSDKENSASTKQVGVIRPMTRSTSSESEGINERDEKNQTDSPKEVFFITKDDMPPPPMLPKKSWNSVSDRNKRNTIASNLGTNNSTVVKPSWLKDKPESTSSKGPAEIIVKAKPAEVIEEVVPKSEPLTNGVGQTPEETSLESNQGKSHFREDWKKRKDEEKNTIVFNFVNTQKDVTHIDNDGRDISNRKSGKKRNQKMANKDSGIILINGGGGAGSESTDCDIEDTDSDDSDIDVHRPMSPCNFVFIGANIITGKSSLRSKEKSQKMSIKFSPSLTEVFEYQSFEAAIHAAHEEVSSALKSNSALGGHLGGLGSYTPSKIQLDEAPFQLGVSRSKSQDNAPTPKTDTMESKVKPKEEGLRPTEDAISWSGSSSSSDILF